MDRKIAKINGKWTPLNETFEVWTSTIGPGGEFHAPVSSTLAPDELAYIEAIGYINENGVVVWDGVQQNSTPQVERDIYHYSDIVFSQRLVVRSDDPAYQDYLPCL